MPASNLGEIDDLNKGEVDEGVSGGQRPFTPCGLLEIFQTVGSSGECGVGVLVWLTLAFFHFILTCPLKLHNSTILTENREIKKRTSNY